MPLCFFLILEKKKRFWKSFDMQSVDRTHGEPHQFPDLTLQVEDTVQFPLPTALGCNAILTSPSHVVDELQLL